MTKEPATELERSLIAAVQAGLQAKGWTQAHLSHEVKITRKHMSALLCARSRGSLDVWSALLSALDISFVLTVPASQVDECCPPGCCVGNDSPAGPCDDNPA